MDKFILFTTYMIEEITTPNTSQNFLFSKKRHLISFPFSNKLNKKYRRFLKTTDAKEKSIYRIEGTNIFAVYCLSFIYNNLSFDRALELLKELYNDIYDYLKEKGEALPNEETQHYFFIHEKDLAKTERYGYLEKSDTEKLGINNIEVIYFKHEHTPVDNILTYFNENEFEKIKKEKKITLEDYIIEKIKKKTIEFELFDAIELYSYAFFNKNKDKDPANNIKEILKTNEKQDIIKEFENVISKTNGDLQQLYNELRDSSTEILIKETFLEENALKEPVALKKINGSTKYKVKVVIPVSQGSDKPFTFTRLTNNVEVKPFKDFRDYLCEKFNLEEVESDEEADLIFIFAQHKHIADWRFYSGIANHPNRKPNEQDFNPKPFVTFLWYNLAVRKQTYDPLYYKLRPDRRYRFLDSSIWYFLVGLDDLKNQLKRVFTEYEKNKNNGLYDTYIALEHVEFNTRRADNSYLKRLKFEKESQQDFGHGNYISPFVFHSEGKFKKLYEKERQIFLDFIKKAGENFKPVWHILIIDDYAKKPLRSKGKINKNKLDIIQFLLKDNALDTYFKFSTVKDDTKDIVQQALKMINPAYNSSENANTKKKIKIYDIIFLDYLLAKSSIPLKLREYGFEFLTELEKETSIFWPIKGPLGKYWIFPITTFTTALFDRLQERGINKVSDLFYISDGGDPINTPYKFLYNLTKFLNLQLKLALFNKEEIIRFLANNHIVSTTESKEDEEVRLWARKIFGLFIYQFGSREIISYDKSNNSAFAKSVLQFLSTRHDDEFRLYDNVRQLLYLLGYGTGSEASRMWNLANFVEHEIFDRSDLNNILKGNEEAVKNLKATFRDIIPRYITNLTNSAKTG